MTTEEPQSVSSQEASVSSMSIPTAPTFQKAWLNPSFVYGINTKASDCVVHADTNHVMYPAGRFVAVSALDTPDMSFLPPRDASVKGISAMAISPNRKYVAIGERTTGQTGMVALVNLATASHCGVLTWEDSKEIISLAFSGDGKFLAAQTGPPDWTLVVWDWDDRKVVGTVKLQTFASRASFNPWDTKYLVTSGKKHLQLWRMSGAGAPLQPVALEGLHDDENRTWSHHTWMLGDILIACTDPGEVFIFERGVLHQILPPFHEEFGISYIAPLTKGLVAAGGGKVSVLESVEEGQGGFVVRKTFDVPYALCAKGTRITCVSVPLSETNVVCATNAGQCFQLSLDLAKMSLEVGQDLADHIFAHSKGYHCGALTGLDVAMRRPIAVTTGADSTVRVWNYQTRKCELAKSFKEEAVSAAVHPMGMMAAIGFSDKLKLCSILVDDIRIEHCYPIKNCREVRFSNGGQFVVAASQNTAHVFSAVTNSHLSTLRGHVGIVKALAFSKDDRKLVTVSIDGAIFEWSTQSWQRVQDNVVKTCAYTAVTYDDTGNTVICASSDRMLRMVVDGKIVAQVSSGGDVLTALVYSEKHRVVIGGSAMGFVRVFEYPLTGSFKEYPVHSGSVSRVRLSPQDEYLFSAGEDGALYTFVIASAVADAAAAAAEQQKRESTDETSRYVDLTMVGLGWIKDVLAQQRDSQGKMDAIAKSVEAEVAAKMAVVQDEVSKMEAAFEEKLKQERANVQSLLESKAKAEAKHIEDTKANSEKHAEAMKSLETAYKKINDEVSARLDQLAADKALSEKQAAERLEQEKKSHEESRAKLEAAHAAEMDAQKARYAALEQQFRDEQELHDAEVRQQEEEFELALNQAREKASHMIQIERDTTGTMERVGSQVRRRLDDALKEQVVLRNQLDRLQAELDKSRRVLQEKDEEVMSLKRDLNERSETVAQKEQRLSELKMKNQELEKFRYVLEYKIAELKDQLGPHETTIAAQKEQIQAMNDELQRTLQKLEEMKLKHNEHFQKVDAGNKQLSVVKAQLAEKEKYVKTLVESIHRLYTEADGAEWRAGFKRLYQMYVTERAAEHVTAEEQDRMKELARQREYMEHSLEVLKNKESRQENRHRVDLDRRTTENIELINEMNRLRRENRAMQEQITSLQNKLESGSVKAAERVKAKLAHSPPPSAKGKKPSKSPNSAPSASALAHMKSSEANADADRAEVAHLEQLLEQKNHTIDQLKEEMERLTQQLAILTTDMDRGTTLMMSSSGKRPGRSSRPLSSPMTPQKDHDEPFDDSAEVPGKLPHINR